MEIKMKNNMKKKVKLGFVTLTGRVTGAKGVWKVEILNEFDTQYEIDYIKQMSGDIDIDPVNTLMLKDRISDIHEKELTTWESFWWNGGLKK